MWICFNDGFVSAVEHRDDATMLMVRARRPGILERLFPNKEIIIGGSTDYNYRVMCGKEEFADIVAANVKDINYDNFKNSVKDRELHDLYERFWKLHYDYQR